MLRLTSSMLHTSPRLHTFLVDYECYDKLYKLLSETHLKCFFENEDIQEIANIFFNLSTYGFFYHIVEKNIVLDSNHTIEEQIVDKELRDFTPICKYIPIKIDFFLSFLLKCLFEWNVSEKIKHLYLFILERMITSSLSNAAVCGKVND